MDKNQKVKSRRAAETKSQNDRRRGTTVIELAICIVLLSIALPPLISAFADASRQASQPGNEAIASFLAIERMEEIVARRYRASDGYAAVTQANFPNESPVSGFAGFSRAVTVTLVTSALGSSGSDVGYKKVRVTVTYSGNSVVIERLFANFS